MPGGRTYLDWNATAPLCPAARSAMVAALDLVGNPSSVHAEGRAARRVVEDAREKVAHLVGARPAEVVFTSGATEANAIVLAQGWHRIAASPIEHDSVSAPARSGGAELIEIPALPDGRADVSALATLGADAAGSGPTLASLQLANNETGVLQPVAALTTLASERGLLVHTDAVQAVGRVTVDFEALGVAYLSMSSHKIGGPKGAGALVMRDGVPLEPLLRGGGQERRRRAGTENVAAIAGFGAAAEVATEALGQQDGVRRLRDMLEAEVRRVTPAARIIGADVARLPNTSCIALPGRDAEMLVAALDLAGVAVSAGAACSSGKVGASSVLKAMGLGDELARSAIRVSLGATSGDADIAAFLGAWTKVTSPAARAA